MESYYVERWIRTLHGMTWIQRDASGYSTRQFFKWSETQGDLHMGQEREIEKFRAQAAHRLMMDSDDQRMLRPKIDIQKTHQSILNMLRSLWHHSSDAMFIIRIENGRYYSDYFNPAQQRVLPSSLGLREPLDEVIPPAFYKVLADQFAQCIQRGQTIRYRERGSGNDYWLTTLVPLLVDQSSVRYVAGVSQNIKFPTAAEQHEAAAPAQISLPGLPLDRLNALIDERVQERTRELLEAKTQAEQLALIDPLTGIANRRGFQQQFEDEWRSALRHQHQLSLAMIDIDHFKHYNDHHGHLKGDWALQQVAALLQEQMRRPRDLVARIGGEEFIILLPETDQAGAEALMRDCQLALQELAIANRVDGQSQSVFLTLSIGGATCRPAQAIHFESALSLADEMLYAAKHNGRNCIRWQELR